MTAETLDPQARTIPAPVNGVPRPAVPAEPVAGDARDEATVEPLRGVARTIAANMDLSLGVPTATSVRTVSAKVLVENRAAINEHLGRTVGGKLTFTHLIGWALVRSLRTFPGMNAHYEEQGGRPVLVTPAHVNLGVAVDVVRADGTRTLVVPSVKRADEMGFREFVDAYDDLVRRAGRNALVPADHAGATLSLTNPGGVGTQQSIPRLMAGQGLIIGAGSLEVPAGYSGASGHALADLGVGPVITLTSTYDHRVIQGAASGELLRAVDRLLNGADDFYEEIYAVLKIPYAPVEAATDVYVREDSEVGRQARVQALIEAYRMRGHLIADVDPVAYQQRSNLDLALSSHGLTLWDLDREHVAGDLGGSGPRRLPLRDILSILRDAYCRTLGVEYMHIADPVQRRWFQERLEKPYRRPSHEQQVRILAKLNQAEAFETFLQTKYVGQTRFSLEGSEALLPLLDELMSEAAVEGFDGAELAMAHRGRLNVLTNIAGKRFSELFREFDGTQELDGSGDVKYHLGTSGVYRGLQGQELPVHMTANPSHLEAVDAVLMGTTRAQQDRRGSRSSTLPVIIHGDAAMAGQGVVSETVQMSKLAAYDIGGSIRITVNNQIGFTTLPSDARSSTYATDVVKAVQAPVLHVNGDDPEAVVRAAQLAFDYRQTFHRDVVIDLIGYRRRGHNEADDPSMTQPGMYDLIGGKASVRSVYLDALLRRGDVSQAEFDAAHRDFETVLEQAFAQAREDERRPAPPEEQRSGAPAPDSTRPTVHDLGRLAEVITTPQAGFVPHPRVAKLLAKRRESVLTGELDWATGELLALGSLAHEGTPVRLVGQDSGRGTFAQRHALVYDRLTGARWSALEAAAADGVRAGVHDSFLSEYAAMAFEYGYSVESPESLVLWEAQFGDFANGAQIVVDEFLSSAEQKWGQRSSLVLLLPHGLEGKGPDHSSGRIERFLQLCAENNMIVAQPTTPASYFHLLREQAARSPRKPLVVFTPKSMLRARGATSTVDELAGGTFAPVLDDARIKDPAAVRRVLVVSGKIYYEVQSRLEKLAPEVAQAVAVVRLEQLYPAPVEQLRAVLDRYQAAECVWLQEEPRNQGAWTFMATEVFPALDRTSRVVSRPPAAAPATGSPARHAAEDAALIAEALSIGPAPREL
ncbi:multifunctional oxoglutarate decarboxylase/oxoglutarate dehydrogenase thiamine pyrophosphate-binding subunit/dihydrolipoyllysine-residue succinyltransferase subunit [Nocardioides sp. URHA0032]|uniref:multifunctional oxoglutarate decarboxylase/oxoglutarate dehydrogenase thiamine pyrophosphate-binding subunit/dihydrolipoyllysine-residue succinyltransferase subunit n=1 Tax=Nocardioides sp. URHA0032 TaxID=1380388 RepID=UPI0018CC28A1|nr:multifunctional oxoglutarate decarboxylase/oxoglutarate dehydrogenase thiamine pyrophosphate-binding subunit/dihydrolipoyllysine-residue succinyltransferase subunit [Nocardioides sp. URHA0032]